MHPRNPLEMVANRWAYAEYDTLWEPLHKNNHDHNALAATRKGPQVYFSSVAPPLASKMPLKASIEINVFYLSFYNPAMNFYGEIYVKNTTFRWQGHYVWI
jgi:hypothetical protein